MTKHINLSKTLAYVYMPVLFALIGYFLLFVALKPVFQTASAAANFLIADDVPVFSPELETIFDPEAASRAAVDYHIDEKTGRPYIKVEDIDLPTAGTRYANLTCDRIELNAPVYWDDTSSILRAGAGQSLASFLPGFGRIIILSAHNTTYFAPLEYIEEGDIIKFDTNYCRYEYEVFAVEVMDEKALEQLFTQKYREEEERLYIYTCYPFGPHVGRKTDRLVAIANRKAGCDVKWKASQYE